ncbi:hypothetical protein HGRIS_006481 [Hohenbuehelia grisea]|uniref:Uncharacterized protein n=1 Tax=Hohenbuehelia grisea TaxID=104357 RepID=A0ABR3K0B8_9AGAR
MGVLDVFFSHLDADKVPPTPNAANRSTPAADRAFMSLLGLSKAANFLRDPSPYSDRILEGWPGLFKWGAFFYAVHIQHAIGGGRIRRSTQDLVAASWFSVTRVDRVAAVMASTKGCIEIATKLWAIEDTGEFPTMFDIPSASAMLDSLLRETTDLGDALDRVVASSGGKVENVTKLSLSRLRAAYSGPRLHEPCTAIYLDLIGHLSRRNNHPLRFAFLSHNLPAISGTANAEARNEALVQRARDHPGKFAMIHSKIANGQSFQLVLTLISGDFWSDAEQKMNAEWGEG